MNGRVNGRRRHRAPAARFPSSYEMRPPSRRPSCPLRGSARTTAPGTDQQRAFLGQVAGMGISRGNLVRAFSECADQPDGDAADGPQGYIVRPNPVSS